MTDSNVLEDQPVAWTPTPEVIERSRLMQFMRQVGVSTWEELYQYSINDVEVFTGEVLRFLGIEFHPPYEKLLDTVDGIEFPKWCEGGGLNITEYCLDRWVSGRGRPRPHLLTDGPALIWEGEEGGSKTLTYAQLLSNVEACAEKLCDLGLTKGDAVGIHLPMIPETVVALLAINRIGAIAVPVFSGYGIDAITSRMEAVGAKAIFTCDGFPRRGKAFDMLTVAARAVANVSSIESVIVIERNSYVDAAEHEDHVRARERRRDEARRYEHLKLDLFSGRRVAIWGVDRDSFSECDYRAPSKTMAEDPLIILYTSGTTGRPKGIAHTHASFPIKAAQDMAFGTDVGPGTRICWYTDIGWMMGPWLIYGALINGGTICIYDGAPDFPGPDRMWEFCAKHRVEILGISPTLIRALSRSADTPVRMSAGHEQSVTTKPPSLEPQPRRGWSRKGRLPHFDGEVTQFLTFRLADSLPRSVLERIKLQMKHDKLDDNSEEYRERIEEYLDRGAGECLLRNPAIARIVVETLLKEDGVSCDLKAWVIMPNHAHVLLRMLESHDLAGFVKRIKGISARRINQALGREGTVWQPDYFDRYIRDAEHFESVRRYIERNPVVAGLADVPEGWGFGSAFERRASPDNEGQSVVSSFAASGDADKSVRAPYERHDLSALRAFASTGEPWNPAPWWWLFEKVGGGKLPIINYSGGTEISGGILMGNMLLPQKPCSFPAPCPGMDVDILDESGVSVGSGKVGELVIKQPWIGMARGFWQERERYLETYWSRFENIWVHGDWAMRDKDGHWFILGRSDDTLKVAGKRVGPAEVESLLVAHPLVTEAAVIGVPDEMKGTAMVAFCVLRTADAPVRNEGVRGPLEDELRALVARDMGKPLTPSKIHFVSALPKTRNAKVMRRVIRSAYLGEDAGDLSALEDPGSVRELRRLGGGE